MTSDPLTLVYDSFADEYHLIYADWHRSIARQSEVLDRVIREAWRRADPPRTVLDCTAGIGTQAIGLAQQGYTVTATDLSPEAIERARREAESMGLTVITGVADLRTLADQVEGAFDVVLTADNALPHLHGDDLRLAVNQMAAKVAPGGLLIATIRDYDAMLQEKPQFTSQTVFDDPDGRRIAFQVLDWADDPVSYTFQQFIVRQGSAGWQTSCYEATYYPFQRDDLTALLSEAGLHDIKWLMPEESGYYQPIVMAHRQDS